MDIFFGNLDVNGTWLNYLGINRTMINNGKWCNVSLAFAATSAMSMIFNMIH